MCSVKIKKLFAVVLIIFINSIVFAVTFPMTPYMESVDTDIFFNGCTFVVDESSSLDTIVSNLRKANEIYNINTITIYGFESLNTTLQNAVFDTLEDLEMKIVVRVESYPSDFSFSHDDALDVVSSHEELFEVCSRKENRNLIAYFAVNMPVDDLVVQKQAGGLNTKEWKNRQLEYAEDIIRLLREKCAEFGWKNPKLYLSVFYGWDNTFDIPSYESAGADGYFINNYSYPKNGQIRSVKDSESDLINADRLKKSMKRYIDQYSNSPVVMEWGFHTVEYNGGYAPNQTAGLVKDFEAKAKAIKATVDFYQDNYPQVQGCLYFGFNLMKEEGNPPALLDWCLDYPPRDDVSAILGSLSDGAEFSGDVVVLNKEGASVSFGPVEQLQMVVINYSSPIQSDIEIYSSGRLRSRVRLPASDGFVSYGIPTIATEGSSLMIVKKSEGDFKLSQVVFSDVLEVENASGAKSIVDEDASNNKASSAHGEKSAIGFKGVRGGDKLAIRYKSDKSAKITLMLDGKKASFSVPASSEYRTIEVKIPIYRNADLSLYSDSNSLLLDYISLSGIPTSK